MAFLTLLKSVLVTNRLGCTGVAPSADHLLSNDVALHCWRGEQPLLPTSSSPADLCPDPSSSSDESPPGITAPSANGSADLRTPPHWVPAHRLLDGLTRTSVWGLSPAGLRLPGSPPRLSPTAPPKVPWRCIRKPGNPFCFVPQW